MRPELDARYDCIVIGGGTSGSILAARLSEDRARRVLLLEAGPDYPAGTPAALRDVNLAVLNGYNWDFEALVREEARAREDALVREEVRPVPSDTQRRVARVFEVAARASGSTPPAPSALSAPGPAAAARTPPPACTPTPALTLAPTRATTVGRMPYPLAKIMGGGSAINGGLALHARPEDYARWRDAGCDQWDWAGILPSLQRVMTADAEKPALPIVIEPAATSTRTQRAFLDACRESGWNEVDLRDGSIAGVGVIPKCTIEGRRVSTAALYLTAARTRANLTIQPGCLVDRLILERREGGWAATGVDAIVDGRRCKLSGGHVVLAAGAVSSPAILMRSGIGPAAAIARAGATPVHDLAGVGRNLQDHPSVSMWAIPKPAACVPGETVHHMMLQVKSTITAPLCDLQLVMLSGVPTRAVPRLHDALGIELAIGVSVIVATPESRGWVDLVSADPSTPPQICVNSLHEPDDVARMTAGVRTAWQLLTSRQFAADVDEVVMWRHDIITSDARAGQVCRHTARATWHPVGTLRMGAPTDPMSVVDQCGRVRGVDHVTVADASIMPQIPSVPTSLPCMVIAERMAELLS